MLIAGDAVAVSEETKSMGMTGSSLKPINELAKAGEEKPSKSDGASDSPDSKSSKQQEKEAAAQERFEKQKMREERVEIESLAARDREVRAHEQAHVAAGGQYAGSPSYQYERGPNGVSYAVSGEVPISTGKEATPEATIAKAEIVRRAALAPAEPSPQDRRVAAAATQMEAEARRELAQQQREEVEEKKAVQEDDKPSESGAQSASQESQPSGIDAQSTAASDRFRRQIFATIEPSSAGLSFSAYA